MLHVLIIGYVWPEPRSSAAGSRMMQLIHSFLDRGWRVTFASAAQRSIHRADLVALGIEEADIALNCDSFNDQVRQWQPDMVVFDRFFTEEQFGWRSRRSARMPYGCWIPKTCIACARPGSCN